MRQTVKALTILILVLSVSASSFAAKKSSTTEYLESLHNQGKERVIVRFEDGINTALIKKYQGKVIRKLKIIDAVVCEIDQDKIELLKQEKGIRDVVPDMVIRMPEPRRVQEEPVREWEEEIDLIIPTAYDGNVTVRWNNLEAGLDTQAAWDNYNLDGTGIKIAFLDQGVNYTLPDINANYLGGEDFVEDDGDPFTDDVAEDHGTKVIALAVGEGESVIVGPAYNASYYAVKVADKDLEGFISDVISGIEWASTEPHKADIISMSLAGYGLLPALRDAFEAACNNAYNQGIVVVAGSGNEGYPYSGDPAAFANVISVGGHAENQTLYDHSGGSTNGGVDVVTPGARVATIKPDNSGWWVWGTSFAAPHVSALIALQLQYARQNNIEVNNGYLWEVMKHSAKQLTGEPYDPVYQGKGKIWAAGTDSNDPNLGSIDLIASHWPIDYDFQFTDYAFIDANSPVYRLGEDVNQSITLTNITHAIGNDIENIENLIVTIKQTEYDDPNLLLGGNSVKVFPTVTVLEPSDANSIELSYSYTIPPDAIPGLKKTTLQMEFNFVDNSRTLQITYNNPDSAWYAAIPGDLNLSNTVNLPDFVTLSQNWQDTGCGEPDYCNRADVDKGGTVDLADLRIVAENWLESSIVED